VKLQPIKTVPGLIALGVVAGVCVLRLLNLDFFDRIERITYDMRVRHALSYPSPIATNLGFVYIDEDSIRFVRDPRNNIGFHFGLYWPRSVYGRLVGELADEGAKATALDVIFGELRDDHPPVPMADETLIDSDEFFARQLRRSDNVILATTEDIHTPPLFRTNALAMADISSEKDSDGILRRERAFSVYRRWHPAFKQVESDPGYGVDLDRARVEKDKIVLLRSNGEEINVLLDKDGNFDLADFAGDKLPAGIRRFDKPFTEERLWHLGIVLAAQGLGLDLADPKIDLGQGRITLRGPQVQRTIPVDKDGFFYINWSIPPNHPKLLEEPIQKLLAQSMARLKGQTNELVNSWKDKLAIVGSSALIGNELTDRGATPFSGDRDTLLVSKHWNVANSILTGQFVRRTSARVDLAIILGLGLAAAGLSWQLRGLPALGAVILLYAAYVSLSVYLYVGSRYWTPLFLPSAAGLLMYLAMATWKVVFENAERRRIRSIFSTMVSPNIVNELLDAPRLGLGGARREVTVLFSDVRGFTELTDSSQERAVEFVRKHNLTNEAAEQYFDNQADQMLKTVNEYLSVVADTVKMMDGTVDKFIGDCVMAFWGAPAPKPKHASACVRAAIQAQRAIHELNQRRASQNQKIEEENAARFAAGLEPTPLLPLLMLGSGINTGMATAGLMGLDAKERQFNYTVFGREVNLASRLESLSGRGHIFISEATYQRLKQEDPDLAATCVQDPTPRYVKGIATPIKVYEAPWRPSTPKQAEPESPPLKKPAEPEAATAPRTTGS
jgi:class 3 adenylate cyclase/CHASE2 domain-containing sensor protein